MTAGSHFLFLVACVRLSIVTIAISRFAKFIPLPKRWTKTEEEHHSLQRCFGVTIIWVMLLTITTWWFGQAIFLANLYCYLPTFSALAWSVYALIVNSVLFNGNLMYHFYYKEEDLVNSLKLRWKIEPVSLIKVLVVAPAYEEAVFSVFLYSMFTQLEFQSALYFSLAPSLCFGLSHIHMHWEFVMQTIKTTDLSITSKIKSIIKEVQGHVLTTTIFSLYSKVIFIKTGSFWPCFFMHSYCNLMGTPAIGFDHDKLHHIAGILGCIILLVLF